MYENMSIQISSRERLRKKTAKLEENQSFLQNVRSLRIWGSMCKKSEEREYASRPLSAALNDQVYAEYAPNVLPAVREDEIDNDWSPLVSLIENCKKLTDLIWACGNQFPPCLLQAIKEKHPGCRLDLRCFRFKSANSSDCADEHERELLQSRFLHSLSARPDILSRYQLDALREAVKAAPNLKHVRVIPALCARPDPDTRTKEWKGFQSPLGDTGKKPLSSLMLLDPLVRGGLRLNDLLKWSDCIDLTKIQFLTLGNVTDPELIIHLRKKVQFSSLEMLDLEITLAEDWENEDLFRDQRDLESLTAAAISLFEHLKPLKDVRLSGYIRSSLLETIFERHGSTLRNIALNPTFGTRTCISPEEIRKIESSCPQLVHLEMFIRLDTNNLNNSNLSDFCPNLSNLQEFVCHDSDPVKRIMYKEGKFVEGNEPVEKPYEISDESSDESPHDKYLNMKPSGDQRGEPTTQERTAEKIWSVIREKKRGAPLKALHLIQFSNCVSLRASETDKDKFTRSRPIACYPFGSRCRTYEYVFRGLQREHKYPF